MARILTDMDWNEEAAGALRDFLTTYEVESLQGIRHNMNSNIHWGKVVAEALPELVASIEAILFQETGVTKTVPLDDLFPAHRNFMDDPEKGELRRKYVVLQLTKKLLGALKTRINQEIQALPILSLQQEENLVRRSLSRQRARGPKPRIIPAGYRGEEGPKEETVTAHLRRRCLGKLAEEDNGTPGCQHKRTTVSYKDVRSQLLRIAKCKDCDLTVSSQVESRRRKVCRHRNAEWVPGKEGKEARCAEIDCLAPIPNPESFQWRKVGLEPFGDDPSQDEAIVLGTTMEEA